MASGWLRWSLAYLGVGVYVDADIGPALVPIPARDEWV